MRSIATLRAVALSTVLAGGLVAAPAAALAANPEGEADATFGSGGLVSVPATNGEAELRSTVLPDGSVLAAGTGPGVSRYTAAGAADTGYGVAGVASVGAGAVYAIEDAGEGRVVVGGSTNGTAFVARLTPTGALDPSFSGDGIATIPALTNGSSFEDVAVDQEGRVVAVGVAQDSDGFKCALVARFTAAGALDATFAGTGWDCDFGPNVAWAHTVVVQPDGAIISAGRQTNDYNWQAWSVRVARYSTGGTIDTSYTLSAQLPTGSTMAIPTELLLDDEGRATVIVDDLDQVVVARFTADGAPDPGFGTDGIAIVGSQAAAVGTDPDGALAANGKLMVSSVAQGIPVLARLLSNGVMDPTFSAGGVGPISTDIGDPTGLGVDGAGRIIVAGATYDAGSGTNRHQTLRVIGDATRPFGATVFPGSAFAVASRSIRWTASDDNSGIKDFDVRYRTASTSSSTLGSATTWKSNTTATAATLGVTAGRTYCLQARADDNAGNTSAYSRQACIAFPVNDRSLARSGSWSSVSSSGYYLGTASRSTSSGATLKRTSVQYRTLAVVATTCPGCGKVAVYLGATKLATLDLSSSTTKRKRIFIVDTSAAVKSGTVTLKQVSGGKPVIIEGLGVSLY